MLDNINSNNILSIGKNYKLRIRNTLEDPKIIYILSNPNICYIKNDEIICFKEVFCEIKSVKL